MTARIAATTAVAAALALPATAAGQPVLAPLQPCYVAVTAGEDGRQAVTVAGSGFTPGAAVDVTVDGALAAQGVVIDAAGNLPAGTVPAPFVARGSRPFEVVVAERGGGLSAAATSSVTRLTVRVRPRTARPSSRVRFRGSGFTADRPVFLHYVRGRAARRTVRLARRPADACGGFSTRRRLFPFLPSTGRWTLQVDQRRRYARRPATAFLRLRVDVRER